MLPVLLLWTSACERNGEPGPAAPKASPEARIQELIEALEPLQDTVTSDITDQKFIRQQKLLAELSAAGPEVGRAALAALRKNTKRVVAVETGLLTVGARAATADALPLLESLVTQYGPALDIRTEATLLIAEVAPARALELIEPLVVKARPNQTTAPAEFLVRAYITACEKSNRSPVKVLADVATNLFQDGSARVRAVKELGKHKEELAVQALRAILVESTGDGYLRRMASQSLLAVLPRETACEIFKTVAGREADLNMLRFLSDVLEKNCGQ